MNNASALIIDDEPDICHLLEITLKRMGINPTSAQTLQEAKKLLRTRSFDICLTDMRLPDGDGLELVSIVQENYPALPIAVITAHGNMETAIKALKNGAFDFISKPIDLELLRNLVSSALKLSKQSNTAPNDFIGQSYLINNLRKDCEKLARSQAPVYISGPTGSGKELVARYIHQSGPRSDGPFIPVNCGAIAPELMESEFFGHIKGSFTGATYDKNGFFQAAHKGTLFLDEVADLPLNMQVKLLRAIQEKTIRPVGSNKELPIDVRILCATHKNLHQMVVDNLFRQDLFYRLNVIEIKVPSLKDRIEDLPLLTQHILEKISLIHEKKIPILESEAITLLKNYAFPGNVRELENILERALTLCNDGIITATDLQFTPAKVVNGNNEILNHGDLPLDDYLLEMEKQAILQAIEKSQGNKTAAAKLLGVSFRTLRYRLKKLGMDTGEN